MTEQTYMIFHPTRLAFLKWYIIAILMLVIGALVFLDVLNTKMLTDEYRFFSLIAFIAAGICLIAIAEIMRIDDDYAITSERIVERKGLIEINQGSVYWEKLSNFSFKQSLFDRIFGIGTIELWSIGGEDKPQIIIKRASNFKKLVSVLNKLVQKR
jgi:uncharacterized membrane protein YdbT with pleckstrin-like domain